MSVFIFHFSLSPFLDSPVFLYFHRPPLLRLYPPFLVSPVIFLDFPLIPLLHSFLLFPFCPLLLLFPPLFDLFSLFSLCLSSCFISSPPFPHPSLSSLSSVFIFLLKLTNYPALLSPHQPCHFFFNSLTCFSFPFFPHFLLSFHIRPLFSFPPLSLSALLSFSFHLFLFFLPSPCVLPCSVAAKDNDLIHFPPWENVCDTPDCWWAVVRSHQSTRAPSQGSGERVGGWCVGGEERRVSE